GLVMGIHRVSLRARREFAFGIDGHEPEMVGTERVQHEKRAARRGVGQRLCGAAPSLHWIPRRAAIHEREPAVFLHAEARNRIIAAVGREQKAPIRREDDAARALEGVGRAFLTADWLERSGTRAARVATLRLGKFSACIAMIVY